MWKGQCEKGERPGERNGLEGKVRGRESSPLGKHHPT